MIRFLREALRHCTWKLAVAAVLFGVIRLAPFWYGAVFLRDGRLEDLPYRSIEIAIAVACVLPAVLLAEQGGRLGARRLPVYMLTLVIASLCAALLTLSAWTIMCGLNRDCAAQTWWLYKFAFVALGTLCYGGLGAYIYANREHMLRSMRDLGDAQLERAEAERSLAETRLQRLQAQVDPDALLAQLRRVHVLYENHPEEAAAMLDELTEQLRSATRRVPV